MAARAWKKDYVPEGRAGCPYIPGSGRRPYQILVKREGLNDLIAAHRVSVAHCEAHAPDRLGFPVAADDPGALDMDRVAAQIRAQCLGTMTVSRDCLARMHDLCVAANGLDPALVCGADYSKVRFGDLVGAFLPVVGQVSPRTTETTAAFKAIRESGGHAFAFRPVVVTTSGDDTGGDQGEAVLLGITVSPRAFNFREGDSRRLTLGLNPRFEDCMCWVLIAHAYAPPVSYAAINNPRATSGRRQPDDPAEARYKWDAYKDANAHRIDQPGWAISRFGLTDTKQTHKFFVRSVVPWPLPEVGSELRRLRQECGDPGLHTYLVSLPMTQPKTADSSTDRRSKGGMDLRRMLMIEQFLAGTPLEPCLDSEAPLPLDPVRIPAPADCMFSRMKAHADAHFA